ncbi:MAG: Fic family protein [Deltaproteobacteria bacterium]|nr:Fic family protein [Deltaproteobacteria bacterium]
MEKDSPPFEITPQILELCTEIGVLAGCYEGLNCPLPGPELREANRAKTIHGTVAIENNTLSIQQVTGILEGKPVTGPEREILEVKNAIKAYDSIEGFDVFSSRDLCRAHHMLMKDLAPDAGKFRTGAVGIAKSGGVSHIAPPAHLVPTHMARLFRFLEKERQYHMLVRASVFHYELEFIHPFSDGNGRIGRLWERALLLHWHPVFAHISLEGIVKKRRGEYYHALEACDRKGSSEDFVAFTLTSILEALRDVFPNFQYSCS